MANKTFILGAGFSRAINSVMPTLVELSAAVRGDLRTQGIPPPPGHDSPVSADFERWLSYLIDNPPWLSQGDQQRNRGSFSDIAGAVYRCLSALQIRAAEAPQPPWLPTLIEHWETTSATVMTFNYDVLVELAWLDKYGSSSIAWSNLYAIPLTPAAARTGAVITGARPAQGMRLLKLHGSLTWYYSGPDSPPGDLIYDVGVTGPWSIEGIAARYDADDVADREPMIVPPAAVKSPYYRNRALRAQWQMVEEAVAASNEIVIMGFGLPPSDQLVSSMLATLAKPRHLVVPVTRDAEVAGRLRKLLEPHGPVSGSGSQVVSRFAGTPDPIADWVAAHAT
jgi:hypothetical protein